MWKFRLTCYVPILFLLQSFCVLSDRRIHHPSNNSRAALIIYTGSSSYELISTIRHFASHIPPEWIFQVFYANHTLLDPLKRLSSEYRHRFVLSRMHHTWESQLRRRDTLSTFFVKRVDFWRMVVGERILHLQPDSAVCSNSPYKLENFTKYDYIGAPWPYNWLIGGESNYTIPIDSREFFGGNGGLSIRSRESMIQCSLAALNGSYPYDYPVPEDIYFASCLKYYLKSKALPGQFTSSKFAFESHLGDEHPWGCHKCWKHISNVNDLLRICPNALLAALRYFTKLQDPRRRLYADALRQIGWKDEVDPF